MLLVRGASRAGKEAARRGPCTTTWLLHQPVMKNDNKTMIMVPHMSATWAA